MTKQINHLDDRIFLLIQGEERKKFLNGLISNDINNAGSGNAIYAALLTPQVKFFYDLFITDIEDTLYLDCHKDDCDELLQKLTLYKLRAKVDIIKTQDYTVLTHDQITLEGLEPLFTYQDPRHSKMGYRSIIKQSDVNDIKNTWSNYHLNRIKLAVADHDDLMKNKSFILDANFDLNHGVSFTKGCFIGQEVTARMMHRSSLKKRLVTVEFTDYTPQSMDHLTQNGKKVGTILSHHKHWALAQVRIDMLDGHTVNCKDHQGTLHIPQALIESKSD